jgi:hypothetical protein
VSDRPAQTAMPEPGSRPASTSPIHSRRASMARRSLEAPSPGAEGCVTGCIVGFSLYPKPSDRKSPASRRSDAFDNLGPFD